MENTCNLLATYCRCYKSCPRCCMVMLQTAVTAVCSVRTDDGQDSQGAALGGSSVARSDRLSDPLSCLSPSELGTPARLSLLYTPDRSPATHFYRIQERLSGTNFSLSCFRLRNIKFDLNVRS